jgi:hypothetical protein
VAERVPSAVGQQEQDLGDGRSASVVTGGGRERLRRIEEGLLHLYARKDMSEAQRKVLLDAVNHIAWDDAIHIAAPWNEAVSLCGEWFRNLAPFQGGRPDGVSGCWTCLQTAEWFDKNLAKGTTNV